MTRYIDAGVLIGKLVAEKHFFPAIVARAIDDTPTADVVEVVRCKDCAYYAPLGDAYEYKGKKAMHCILRASCTGDNYYCADGMRKEKDNG